MRSSIGRSLAWCALAFGALALASGTGAGCAKGEPDSGAPGSGDTGGAGQGGASGTGGTSTDASTAGTSGDGGLAGQGGLAGHAGTAGAGDGGASGVGGEAGTAGQGGTGGTSTGGTGGTSTGGTGGTGVLSGTLFISEYIEGDYNNKALELFNGSSAPIDLSTCLVNRYQNGSTTPAANSVQLAAGTTLASGQLFTVCSEYAGSVLTPLCDQLDQRVDFNGNDAVELVCNGVTIDVIGRIGEDPGALGWGTGDVTTTNHTLVRKCSVTDGRTDGSSAFDPATEWDGYPLDTFDHLGSRTCP